MIKTLNEIKEKVILFDKDSNGREISMYELNDVVATGESLFYPNVLLREIESYDIFRPINETTMSLSKVSNNIEIPKSVSVTKREKDAMFFFVYNTDNYYHFIYDSLPYLITYKKLLKTEPNIKLLMNYPNVSKKEHYKFVLEFLKLLGINDDKIRIIDNETLYETILLSTSYTHDFDSNLPPRDEVYTFLKELATDVKHTSNYTNTPKKIYVSRRSWKHGDYSNIGTNYTTRRKMMNEDALVELLEANGYTEVFTENMTTEEKIVTFSQAEKVIGAIGGGLCNVLFSNSDCELISINSPNFLDVNERFKYSFKNVKTSFFDNTHTIETTDLKTYMRIKVGNVIGEITEINGDDITIAYSDTKIAGWNNDVDFKTMTVKANDCIKLDNGLNSPWTFDIEEFKNIFL